MKIFISFVSSILCLAALQAQAGHEVNDGSLTTWYCQGTGYLKGSAGTVKLPFQLRVSPLEVELQVLSTTNTVLRTEKLFLDSTTVNYSDGTAELRSYKQSGTLMKDLAAYITIKSVGQVIDHAHDGTVDFALENGVSFFANTMACNNYF